jgi:MiaB-like tRNA modifying enzyme
MKYYIESYGCTMNYGEGDMLSRRMESLGYERVDKVDESDIVILNTCTVVETTEKRMIKRMNDLRAARKEVIVTGCMAKVQQSRISIRLPNALIVPPDMYDNFSELVENRFGVSDSTKRTPYGRTAIIPIAQGCLGNCTYCITRFARGKLISRSIEDIAAEFKEFVESGVREILITAQDTACYGKDIGTYLPALLEELLKVEGDYKIRIGMMNPNHLKPILDRMIDCLLDPRVYRFLHVPVQSGSDAVLKAMKRHYTADAFLETIDRLRERIPDISIATDLICGFPGETEEDHKDTIDLMRRLRMDTANITRYSPRPGTDSITLPGELNGNVTKQRSQELTEVKTEVEYDVNSKLVGRKVKVLITENGKDGTMIGRTINYRPIGFRTTHDLGEYVEVEITGCAATYLTGKEI